MNQKPRTIQEQLCRLKEKGMVFNDEQKAIAEKYVKILTDKGFKVATQLRPAKDHEFWDAEDYHQQYYEKKNGTPYCHIYRKIF